MCICNVGKDDICKVTVVMKLIKFLSLILQNMECKSLSDQYAAQVTALTSLKDEVISQDCFRKRYISKMHFSPGYILGSAMDKG